MNIDYDGYERAQILNALFSSSRKVRYEYLVSNRDDIPLGFVNLENATISYDSKAEIKRTISGSIIKSEILNFDSLDYRLTPYFCIEMPDGKEIKWKLGVFIISPQFSGDNGLNRIDIQGYDLALIPNDDKLTQRFFVPNGANYVSTLMQLLGPDVYNLDIEENAMTKLYDQEWEIGENVLSVANTMLNAINYETLYFDENGRGISKQHILPEFRTIDFSYVANKTSIIIDGVELNSNKFNIPNKWVRYTESVDAPYLYSEYINDDVNSPYSTINRGRVIADIETVDDIASQDALDSYVVKLANESMAANEVLTFKTLNMPGHGFQECLYIECPRYEIEGVYIETQWEMELETGGLMTHVCERVVKV